MNLIDLHCDTILRCMDDKEKIGIRENELCIDIRKLRKAESVAQFFAMYVDLEIFKDPMAECLRMIDRFYAELEENSDEIRLATNYAELLRNMEEGKLSAFLAVEDGGPIGTEMYKLRTLYRLGVRLITLTWNYPNGIGYPNHEWVHRDKGLTPFGEEAVYEMNRLGMAIDVSHLSDQGFYDVARFSGKPFLASHSNARAVTGVSRNLPDDMIRILADKGGVTGLNYESLFLGDSEIGMISDMVRHIKHIVKVGGIEVMAIGGDLDGSMHETELGNIGEVGRLVDALRQSGFSESDIEKIMYKNAIRFIKDVMK